MRVDVSKSGGVGNAEVYFFTKIGNKLATRSMLNQDKQLNPKESSRLGQTSLKEIGDNSQDGRKGFSTLHLVTGLRPEHMCNSNNITAKTQTSTPPTGKGLE